MTSDMVLGGVPSYGQDNSPNVNLSFCLSLPHLHTLTHPQPDSLTQGVQTVYLTVKESSL